MRVIAGVLLLTVLCATSGTASPADPLDQARALGHAGRYEEAIAEARRQVVAGTADVRATRLFLGLMYYRMARYDQALAEFNAVADAQTPMAHYFLGLIYEQQAVGAGGQERVALQRRALASWQAYRDAAVLAEGRSFGHAGLSPAEAVQRAERHIHMLSEVLGE